MAVQLGPVPATDEKSPVRQNTAIQQLFQAMTPTLQSVGAAAGTDGTGNVVLSPASNGSGNVVRATSPSLTTPVIGAATGTSLAVTGAITSSGGGVGYATGAGGTVTQVTSRATAVTLNKLSGDITLIAAVLAAGNADHTVVNNSFFAATDNVILAVTNSASLSVFYDLIFDNPAAGQFSFYIFNNSAVGSSSEQPKIRFTIVKSVLA